MAVKCAERSCQALVVLCLCLLVNIELTQPDEYILKP